MSIAFIGAETRFEQGGRDAHREGRAHQHQMAHPLGRAGGGFESDQ